MLVTKWMLWLQDPERQRMLMEGYSILVRRIQEMERHRPYREPGHYPPSRRYEVCGWQHHVKYIIIDMVYIVFIVITVISFTYYLLDIRHSSLEHEKSCGS